MLGEQKTAIYYDGKCHLCSREINGYRKKANANRLDFVDIASKQFDPALEGLDAKEVQRVLHVKRCDGSLVRGVDAFIEIWRTLGILGWLAFLAEHQPTRVFFKGGYVAFARLRPFLPKKKCEIDNI